LLRIKTHDRPAGRQLSLLIPDPARPTASPTRSIILTDVPTMTGMGSGMSITAAVSHFHPSVPQKQPSASRCSAAFSSQPAAL